MVYNNFKIKYNKELIFLARGKQKTLEQKIAEIDSSIQELETRKEKLDEKIEMFNQQKQDLLNTANQEKLQQLQEAIAESGLSVDEVLSKLKKL